MARGRTSGAALRRAARVAGSAGGRAIEMLASLVMIVAALCAIVLALHIIFVVFHANPGNGIVVFVHQIAHTLVWKFENLFVPDRANLRVIVNYGVAAAVYLVVGRIVAAVIRRVT